MAKGYQPRSGRHTVTGSLSRAIIHEICWAGIPDRGEIVVDAAPQLLQEPCSIGFYQVRVKPRGNYWGGYLFYPFAGKTRSGRTLSDEECRQIMAHPVRSFSTHGEVYGEGNRHLHSKRPDTLDALIEPDLFIQKALTETGAAEKEEIERLKSQTADAKFALERGLEGLRSLVRTEEHRLNGELSRVEKLESQKKLAALRKELKQSEQNLFMNGLKLDMLLEENIKRFIENAQLTVEVNRQFVVQVRGM